MLYALCSMFYALCSMLYALCSMLYAQCLCSMLYAQCPHMTKPYSKKFLRLYMAQLTIFCGGFLDDFLWLCRQFFAAAFQTTLLTIFYGFLDDFVDNFFYGFQTIFYSFICSTKVVQYKVRTCIQKSVARFEGGGECMKLGGGGRGGCKSYSMDSLLLSKKQFCLSVKRSLKLSNHEP